MTLRQAQLASMAVLLILCVLVNWRVSTRQKVAENHDIPAVLIERSQEKCPPCELFFRKLEATGEDGKLVQEVKVQQRGEPKSGTSFMYDWATATLLRTCDYLNYLFGANINVWSVLGTRHGRRKQHASICNTCKCLFTTTS